LRKTGISLKISVLTENMIGTKDKNWLKSKTEDRKECMKNKSVMSRKRKGKRRQKMSA